MGEGEPSKDESRRILQRIAQETDPSGSLAARTANRARDHLGAADADQADPIELWGTRIGRMIGLVALAAVVVWLAVSVFGR